MWYRILLALLLNNCSWSSGISSRRTKGESSFGTKNLDGRRIGLNIRQFRKVISTEVDHELSSLRRATTKFDGREQTASFWEMTADFEWDRAHNAEKESKKLEKSRNLRRSTSEFTAFPYIVCNTNSTVINGLERKIEVQDYFDRPARDVYNRDDMSCFFIKSLASLAANAPSKFLVHPLTSSMKMQKGSIEMLSGTNPNNVTDTLEYTFDQYGVQVMLCPGVATTESEGTDAVRLIIDDLKQSAFDKGTQKHNRSLSLSDQFFWTSPASTSTDQFRRVLSNHSSSSLWSSAIAQGIDAQHRCFSMLKNLLVTASSAGSDVTITGSDDNLGSRACQLSLVAALALSSDVCVVTIIPIVESRNIESQWIVQSGERDYRPLFDVGLTGRGQIVALSDTGLDTNNCYFWDESGDIVKDGTVDPSRRKVVQYVSFQDSTDKLNGHGTHIAGSIVGRRAQNGRDESNGLADGIARDAKIAFYDMGNSFTGRMSIPPNQKDIFEKGRIAGAHLHSVSWGSPTNVYGPYDYQFDKYLYENDDFMIFVAAGNEGAACPKANCRNYKELNYDISHTVFSPAVAKNVVSVGASNNEGNSKTAWYLKESDNVAFFSARGPTADGRSKPDIIAPGYSVLSAGARPSMEGECDPDSSQVFNFRTVDNNPTVGLSMKYGTSMSAPLATGAAALIRQYFEEGWYPNGKKTAQDAIEPSGSLVKAVLLNGGRAMNRVQNFLKYTYTQEYDQAQNFGMISLIDSLSIAGKNEFITKIFDRKEIKNGVTDSYTFLIDNASCDSNIELSATLVWAEPGATPGCMACTLNDLDLEFVKGGKNYYPNGLNKKDGINNTERIRIHTTDGEQVTIQIIGHNIITPTQKYSLAVTGCFIFVQ